MNNKKEQQIDSMSNEDVVNELKEKKLPTFGTAQERKDRLKKHLNHTQSINIRIACPLTIESGAFQSCNDELLLV